MCVSTLVEFVEKHTVTEVRILAILDDPEGAAVRLGLEPHVLAKECIYAEFPHLRPPGDRSFDHDKDLLGYYGKKLFNDGLSTVQGEFTFLGRQTTVLGRRYLRFLGHYRDQVDPGPTS